MRLIKPKFWEKKNNFLTILLIPFSVVILILVKLKKLLIKPKKFKIPILCVGNIFLGGTENSNFNLYCKRIKET